VFWGRASGIVINSLLSGGLKSDVVSLFRKLYKSNKKKREMNGSL